MAEKINIFRAADSGVVIFSKKYLYSVRQNIV